MAVGRENIIERLDAFKAKRVEEFKDPVDKARLNELVTALQQRIKDGAYKAEKITELFGADFEKLIEIVNVLNDEKLGVFGVPGFEVEIMEQKFNNPRILVMGEVLDHVYEQDPKDDQLDRLAKEFAGLCQRAGRETKAQVSETKLDAASSESLVSLTRKQNPGQLYHSPVHAIEMRKECPEFVAALLKAPEFASLKINPTILMKLIGSLAQHHDDIQLRGQYINERDSADEFVKKYKHVFEGQVSEQHLKKLARLVIIRGTLLSIHFSDKPKHVTLESMLLRIDRDVLGRKDYSQESPHKKLFHVVTLILSHFDISGWNMKTEKRQREMPDDMQASFAKKLAETKTMRALATKPLEQKIELEQKIDVRSLISGPMALAAQGVTAQNGRMQFEAKDKEWSVFQLAIDKARLVGKHKTSDALKKEFKAYIRANIHTKTENIGNDEKKGLNEALNFTGQLGFAKGADSDEAWKGMQYVCPGAAKIFAEFRVIPTNAWSIQAATYLPSLIEVLDKAKGELKSAEEALAKAKTEFADADKPEENLSKEIQAVEKALDNLADCYSEIVFMIANQRGLDIFKEFPDTLNQVLIDCFGMKDSINSDLTDQYIMAYLSLINTRRVQSLFSELETKPENLVALRALFDKKMQEIEQAEMRAGIKREPLHTPAGMVVRVSPPRERKTSQVIATGEEVKAKASLPPLDVHGSTLTALQGLGSPTHKRQSSLTIPGQQLGSPVSSPTAAQSTPRSPSAGDSSARRKRSDADAELPAKSPSLRAQPVKKSSGADLTEPEMRRSVSEAGAHHAGHHVRNRSVASLGSPSPRSTQLTSHDPYNPRSQIEPPPVEKKAAHARTLSAAGAGVINPIEKDKNKEKDKRPEVSATPRGTHQRTPSAHDPSKLQSAGRNALMPSPSQATRGLSNPSATSPDPAKKRGFGRGPDKR